MKIASKIFNFSDNNEISSDSCLSSVVGPINVDFHLFGENKIIKVVTSRSHGKGCPFIDFVSILKDAMNKGYTYAFFHIDFRGTYHSVDEIKLKIDSKKNVDIKVTFGETIDPF